MNVAEFQAKWNIVELKERSAAQEHFLDLCRLAGHPTPAQADPAGERFCFERGASKEGGGEGFADVFHDPERLRPGRTQEAATVEAAARVAEVAAAMRGRGLDPAAVAKLMDRLVFCMFAEDVGLLPDSLFQRLVEACGAEPERLARLMSDLFRAMASGGDFGMERVARFNGSLFEDAQPGSIWPTGGLTRPFQPPTGGTPTSPTARSSTAFSGSTGYDVADGAAQGLNWLRTLVF